MLRIVLLGALAVCLFSGFAGAQGAEDWTGSWDSYWRDGEARMTFEQSGDDVSGVYAPGGGVIEGRVEGRVLRGHWRQDGASGPMIFALSEDGRSFTGRYVDGEYWNGRRVASQDALDQAAAPRATPREALRQLVSLGNAAYYDGDISAVGQAEGLLHYAGAQTTARERRRRRQLLWTLIDISTFRVYDVPAQVEGDAARFAIGPSAADADHVLTFARMGGAWRVVVPSEAELSTALDAMLAALGHETMAALNAARADSPRAAMRTFLQGARAWHEGGSEAVMATMDLSFVPPRLLGFEAPLMAQYLKSVIDRAGYVTWQEIPDDPNRGSVYVFYRHPEGLVAIDRTLGPDGAAGRWKFTARTVRGAPALFAAMQDLPVAGAIAPSPPITPFFAIRERVRAIAPALLHRSGPLDLWQWAAFPAAILVSILLGRLFAAVMAIGLSRGLARAERGLRVEASRRLGAPAGVAAASGMAIFIMVWLGMAETALAPFMVALLSALTASLAWLSFRIIGIAGGYFQRRAERSAGFVDEIATSLVFGVLKLGVIAFGAVAIADVIGIPYEGVIAGLGVGGIALAFAARDTVQNVIGGAILMTDRPFRRGDLVETDATMAFVEGVGLRSTRLRTLDDSVLIIPNSRLTDRSIVNWGQRRKRKIRLEISLSYDTPRDRLDAFVRDLRSVYMLQPGSDGTTGFVGLTSLGSSSLDIELWGYFKVSDHHGLVAARHRLIGDIIDLAHRRKISFAFPTRTIRIVPEIDEDAAASAP